MDLNMTKKNFIRVLGGFDVDASLSGDIVDYLQKQKRKSLREIAEMMGVSKSYLSRVKNRKKGLTLKRLVKLEKELDLPLPLLFLEVTRTQPIPQKIKREYEELRTIWQQSVELNK
jgi:transcriptional regulator with XRE-family HTH domain